MRPINTTLKPGDKGSEVANLQEGLLLLLERRLIQVGEDERDETMKELAAERREQIYEDETKANVARFQKQHDIKSTGVVDEQTRDALNRVLAELGAFDQAPPIVQAMVAGQVKDQAQLPVRNVVVTALHVDDKRSVRLGEDDTDAEGHYAIRYETPPGISSVNLRLAAFDASGRLMGEAPLIRNPRPLETMDIVVDTAPPVTYQVMGKVTSPGSASVGGLRVRIVDKAVGGDVQLAETLTDPNGAYQATFTNASLRGRGKAQPDLQARVFAGETFLAASEVRYDAAERETLNILVEAKKEAPLRSEHETLIADLATYFPGRLSDLQETDGQQDITFLANKSGWDARAVALAALADQFSQRSGSPGIAALTGLPNQPSGSPPIEPVFFYALFRAGLPANEETLYQADAGAVKSVWEKAASQGVIPKTLADAIPQKVAQFQTLSAQKILTSPAQTGVSSFQEMLTGSQLNVDQQKQFAQLYATHRTDLPTLWQAVENSLGKDTASRLQVDGKLGFLTINNAPLIQALHQSAGNSGLNDPLQLAQAGYHRADKWDALLTTDVPIPKEIPGSTPEAKRANYKDYLAAQVRFSYPTAAIAQMVRSGEIPLTGAAAGLSDQVHAFLTEHQGAFEIGMQPVQQYIVRNHLQVPVATVVQVERLQRIYQITTSDQAMAGLMQHGLDAAYRITRYDKDAFVQTFAQDLGGVDGAARIYDRSVDVHHTVLNIALSYVTAKNGIALGAQPLQAGQQGQESSGQIIQPTPRGATGDDNASDVIAYPTLEGLFGEMDFCACEHCRSILSPAAYLVDLLLFIDRAPEPGKMNPQTVLLQRRPDIQHLPLTCENTNTALPYIDVVNETLEYYIANDVQKLSLNGYLGYDTATFASADLLASPQFVMDTAYTILRGERFPMPLPFHQPLESLRRYFTKFEVPLPLAMERLRKNDHLERSADPYGWRDILMEEIGLSRDEYEILTNSPNAIPLWQMYGFPSGTQDADVIAGIPNFAGLSNAKQFTRRIGISYDDIVAILRTRFINPNSDLIPKLERLGVPFAAFKALKDGTFSDAQFDALLPTGAGAPDPAGYDGDIKAWVKRQDNYDRIMKIVTLTDPTGSADPCSFDNLEFRYSRPLAAVGDTTTRLGAVEFVRLLRFIRLWKKLGWSIEQTDVAICSLFPPPVAPQTFADTIDTVAKLDAGFLTLLPQLGIVTRVMKALNLNVKRDLVPLLACWSDIGTHGTAALYRQMFLNPALLKQDAVFADNGYGEFLQKADVPYTHPQPTLEQAILDAASGRIGYGHTTKRLFYNGVLAIATRNALKSVVGVSATFQAAVDALYATQRLVAHAEALRSAFNLTGDEYERIVTALGYNADTPLTIPNISAIFRRGYLARKLKLSVREILLLMRLTGLDPFAAPDPTHPAILRLIELIQSLKERSFKSAAALYLIWNQDLSGKSAPEAAQVAAFARTLRLAFAAVETDFAVQDDPDGAIAQTRMTLVYGANVAAFFFGLLNDTLTTDIDFSDPDGTLAPGALRQAIETAAGKTAAGASKLTYEDFRKRLSYAGVLSTTTRDAIKTAAGVGAATFATAVDDLYSANQTAILPFFTRYPELQVSFDAYVADTVHPVAEKRRTLLQQILPDLIRRRKAQQALQAVSAMASVDLAFPELLLNGSVSSGGISPLHATGHTDQPALNDFLALETQGLSVQFFASDTATGAVIPFAAIAADLNYATLAGGVGNPLPANPAPGAAISGLWRGYLEAPENGFFNLRIETDPGATVTLRLDGKPVALTQNVTLWTNTNPLELRAGTLYPIALTVEAVRNIVRVQWEWDPKGEGRAVIPARYFYPATLFDAYQQAYLRFLKATALATDLGLTAKEMAHFATAADQRIAGDGWLNALPVTGDPTAVTAAALLKPFKALLDYARIKAAIAPDDESLLSTLQDIATATQNPNSLLFSLTRWEPGSLDALLRHFGKVDGGGNADRNTLRDVNTLRRVYEAFALLQQMGISDSALVQAMTNEPTGDTVRGLQAALRARYDVVSWRDVVQPINDELRGLQRDALVAYILHQMRSNPASAHIDTADKLFEYFLMDVQMEPCMQTSRIRHALSSVQLFIERCLMNLETNVSPASINAKQWEWMKRYRVWEANRKVYLYAENWLEPELRDDKSPFFKEIESELLQNDITEERATIALLNYLAKLEEVAKLEPCGIHYIPADGERRSSEISHVVARTTGANRKYYYRRYEGGYWTPWEQIKLEIEDNPVIPVVWQDRLFVFWLRILKESPLKPPQKVPPLNTNKEQGGYKEPETHERVANLSAKDLTKSMVSTIQTDVIGGGESPSESLKINVKAILCWSEYYNGKWQATRTSDIDHPLGLGEFVSFGPEVFDRSKLKLSVLFWTKGSVRIIVANNIGSGSSFFLHNVYSAPELRGTKKEPHFTPKRSPDTATTSFKMDYPNANLSHTLFTNEISDGTVEPTHPVEGDPWDAPFFYQDSRHVFYVTTSDRIVQVPRWNDYGMVATLPNRTYDLPPLVLKPVEVIPDLAGPIIRQPGFGVVNPSPVERFVTEDAYIRRGIGSAGTVSFGDREIGLAGSQVKSIRTR